MKKAGLVALSAIPGIVFAYALLTGILMKRVHPVPITAIPEKRVARRRRTREAVPA
jgi:hypothetical protein